MTAFALLVGAVLSGGAILAAYVQAGWLRRRHKRTVVVHTTNAQTFQGVLMSTSRDGLVLRHAKLEGVAMAGETFIPRNTVVIVQVLGG